MVQEYTSPVRVYEFSFEMVMEAYQKRFPTCKMIPAFLGSDITSEFKSDDGAIHIVERRCKLHVDAPYLVRKIAGVDHAIFIQRNSLNRKDRTLKIEAWNESFANRLIIKENCYYSVHPDNSNWTLFEQDASLDVVSFFGFEAAVEKVAIKAYTSNLKKGKEIIMYYINELIAEGRTEFPRFQDSEGRPRTVSHGDTLKDQIDGKSEEELSDLSNKVINNSADEVEEEKVDSIPPSPSIDEHKLPIHNEDIKKAIQPPPVQDYKLDEAYIARYLGELTAKEEACLMKLRRRIITCHHDKMPKESVLLRFLRARDSNLDKAFEMLRSSLHWRRQHHVDSILSTWNPPAALLEYYPGGWHHHDIDSRPVYIVRLGSMDFKGLLKTVGEDGFVKQVVSINEEGLLKCVEAADIFKKPITNWTLVVDLDGLNMRHLWRPGIRALLKIIEVVEANYPETMGRVLIVRAPKIFGVIWTLLSPFIDETTRKKFMIYTGDDYQGEGGLIDYIPKEFIPDFLGGPCECSIPAGSIVPKQFYKFDHIGEAIESTWLDTDQYQTAHLMKGAPHDVILTVNDAQAVITWDFDVIDGNCHFQVLRHKRPRDVGNGHVTSCLGDTSLSKLNVRPGIDAQVVERAVLFKHGDSVQGTHICQQAGVYILQWKFASAGHMKQGLRLQQQKCKIMYYHEVLPSRDFKGSMSSISSSQSRFSLLSVSSSTQLAGAASLTHSSSHSNASR